MDKTFDEEAQDKCLYLIWIVDCSGSMSGEKIQSLNYAIRNAIPSIIEAAGKNPDIKVLIKVLKFSDESQWHIKEPTELDNFKWVDLEIGGITNLGAALSMVADELQILDKEKALPPVIILLSDGQPTDDYEVGLNTLLSIPIGKNAVKIAIAIGDDADEEMLQDFIDDKERRILKANNSNSLVHFIRWAAVDFINASLEKEDKARNNSLEEKVISDDIW